MSIPFICPKCDVLLQCPDDSDGELIRCTFCTKDVRITTGRKPWNWTALSMHGFAGLFAALGIILLVCGLGYDSTLPNPGGLGPGRSHNIGLLATKHTLIMCGVVSMATGMLMSGIARAIQ